MAVDEALLESVLAGGPPTVRIYRWEEATVSLGYFQHAGEVEAILGFAALPKVRRLTGGGAILHHRELTYSLVLPRGHRLTRDHEALYRHVHGRLIDVLGLHGVAARMRGEAEQEAEGRSHASGVRRQESGIRSQESEDEDRGSRPKPLFNPIINRQSSIDNPNTTHHSPLTTHQSNRQSSIANPAAAHNSSVATNGGEPFLCFGRGDARDVLLAGHKVIGSAQRRRRRAILQHGSVLLARSEHAPQFPGIAELVQWNVTDEDFAKELADATAALCGAQAEQSELTAGETAAAGRLARGKYSTLEWGRRS